MLKNALNALLLENGLVSNELKHYTPVSNLLYLYKATERIIAIELIKLMSCEQITLQIDITLQLAYESDSSTKTIR